MNSFDLNQLNNCYFATVFNDRLSTGENWNAHEFWLERLKNDSVPFIEIAVRDVRGDVVPGFMLQPAGRSLANQFALQAGQANLMVVRDGQLQAENLSGMPLLTIGKLHATSERPQDSYSILLSVANVYLTINPRAESTASVGGCV